MFRDRWQFSCHHPDAYTYARLATHSLLSEKPGSSWTLSDRETWAISPWLETTAVKANTDIDCTATLRSKEDERSRGGRGESDFSCTPAYIVNWLSTSRIYAENKFAGDRNAWTTRNTSLGNIWRYRRRYVETRMAAVRYCRGASFYFSKIRRIHRKCW